MSQIITKPAFEQREYHDVAATTTSNYDYLVPDGKTIYLEELGGDAAINNPNVLVKIEWDPAGTPECVMVTSGDTVQNTKKSFAGDGVKVLRIVLDNQSATTQSIGAYYLGDIV